MKLSEISFLFLLLFLFVPSVSYTQSTPTELAIQLLKDDLMVKEIAQSDGLSLSEVIKRLSSQKIDLNGDGVVEFIVSGIGCGASNCTFWLYRKSGNKYIKIPVEDDINAESVEPRRTKTNGYLDFSAETHGGAGYNGLYVYKYDGSKYVVKECFSKNYFYTDRNGNSLQYKIPKIAKRRCGSSDTPMSEATPTGESVPKTISGGVLNGKAISLPEPVYPAVAKASHAGGAVTVQVLIDEDGNVISASAVSGDPLLRESAVSAAYKAKFSPTKLSGQPVKVSGVITYYFSGPSVVVSTAPRAENASDTPLKLAASFQQPTKYGWYVLNLNTGKLHFVGSGEDVTLSPSAEYVAVGNYDLKASTYVISVKELFAASLRRIGVIAMTEIGAGSRYLTWNADSTQVSATDWEERGHSFSTGLAPRPAFENSNRKLSNAATKILKQRFDDFQDVTFSPDGEWVAVTAHKGFYASRNYSGGIYVFRKDGSRLTQVTKNVSIKIKDGDDLNVVWLPDGISLFFERTSYEDEGH